MKQLLKIVVMVSTVVLTSSVAHAMFTIDADFYADGMDMSTATLGVILSSPSSGLYITDGRVYAQTALDPSHASTGTNVFGSNLPGTYGLGNPINEVWYQDSWNEFRLRADLPTAANYVAIDIIGDSDRDFGMLQAYDSGDNLLTSVSNSTPLYDGDIFTAEITRGAYDIAYIIASGIDGRAVHLDNLRVNLIPAPGAVLLGCIGIGLVGWLQRRGSAIK